MAQLPARLVLELLSSAQGVLLDGTPEPTLLLDNARQVTVSELLSGTNPDTEAPPGFTFDLAAASITTINIMRGKVTYTIYGSLLNTFSAQDVA